MSIWFTADTHFNHQGIIKHCNRPLQTKEEMDELMMRNWNDRVKKRDHIYIVGDFAWSKPLKYLKSLNGQKHLILGNHDTNINNECKKYLSSVSQYKVIRHPTIDTKIFMCHYAMRVWDGSHYGYWHLYGHSHGSLPQIKNNSFDVGVDCWGFKPLSIDEITEIIKQENIYSEPKIKKALDK